MLAPVNYCFLYQELFVCLQARKKVASCTFKTVQDVFSNTNKVVLLPKPTSYSTVIELFYRVMCHIYLEMLITYFWDVDFCANISSWQFGLNAVWLFGLEWIRERGSAASWLSQKNISLEGEQNSLWKCYIWQFWK